MCQTEMAYYIYRDALVMIESRGWMQLYTCIFRVSVKDIPQNIRICQKSMCCFCDNLTILKMVVLHPMQRFNNEVCIDNSFKNNWMTQFWMKMKTFFFLKSKHQLCMSVKYFFLFTLWCLYSHTLRSLHDLLTC